MQAEEQLQDRLAYDDGNSPQAGKEIPDAQTREEINNVMDEYEKSKWATRPSYEFNSRESTLLVEIYLPKKAEYQGALYDTLTDGFEKDKVEAHFRKDQNKKQRIKNMLARHYPSVADYTDDAIDSLKKLFHDDYPLYSGYSMYEVDGVFYSPERGTIEERTQVIRVILRPHFKLFWDGLFELCKIEPDTDTAKKIPAGQAPTLMRLTTMYFDSPEGDRAFFVRQNTSIKLNIVLERFIDFLDEWVDSVALFIFGYLVFNISEKLLKLRDQDQGKGEEEEIWITSSWNPKVNRITFKEGVRRLAW